RGVARRTVARRAQRGIDHRRDRSLAVGPGDMDRAERALGVAEPGDERGNVVEAELDPEVLEAEQIRQRIGQGLWRGSSSSSGILFEAVAAAPPGEEAGDVLAD